MAIPHYTYVQLKMPGPKGVITVSRNFQTSNACDRNFNKISETFGAEHTLEELSLLSDTTYMPEHKKQTTDKTFNTADDTEGDMP